MELNKITTKEEYKVKEILDIKKFNRQVKYLIKWKDYHTSENTWEPVKNLTNCQVAITRFHQKQKKGQGLRSLKSYLLNFYSEI